MTFLQGQGLAQGSPQPRTVVVIILSRLNGGEFALNPDLIERVDSTPDTVITLTDGTKYIVAEPLRELTARVRDYRASVIARANALERTGAYDVLEDEDHNPESSTEDD